MSDVLDKIAKILTLAERTDNEHEADAFFKQAQHLASRYSIELAVARQHVARQEKRETPGMRTVDVGERGAKSNACMVNLFLAIAGSNDVRINIAHNSTYVIMFGFPSDMDATEVLYSHISYQMVEAANAYLKRGEYKSEMYLSPTTWTYRPMDGRVARRSFYSAFTTRIGARLRDARREAKQEFVDAEVEGSNSTALVLASKRQEVSEFHNRNSWARGSWRGGSSSGHSASASSAGSEAGSRARISGQASIGGGHKSLA